MTQPELTSGYIRMTEHQGWLEATLARPDKLNAFTVTMYQDLGKITQYFNANDDFKVMLINSEGRVFSAGNDVSDFLERVNSDDSSAASPALEFIADLLHCEKPVVTAVQGGAVGIGTTLLLHTDLIVAGESAKFHTAFIQLGLVPEAASSLLLPRALGKQNAARLLLAGDKLSAKEAHNMGLVAYCVADDELAKEAKALCEKISGFSLQALKQTKRLMQGDTKTIKERIDEEKVLFMQRLKSPETIAIFQRFMEK